jgi:hypothetical protein
MTEESLRRRTSGAVSVTAFSFFNRADPDLEDVEVRIPVGGPLSGG